MRREDSEHHSQIGPTFFDSLTMESALEANRPRGNFFSYMHSRRLAQRVKIFRDYMNYGRPITSTGNRR